MSLTKPCKDNDVIVLAVKAYEGNQGTAAFAFNLNTR